MHRQKRLTSHDVRAVVRLAWEAALLRNDPAAQARHLIDGLAQLVGGDLGFMAIIQDFAPGKEPKFVFAAPGSLYQREIAAYGAKLGREFSSLEDPVMEFGRNGGDVGALQFSYLLTLPSSQKREHLREVVSKARSFDGLIGFFRHHKPSIVTALSLHRTNINRTFTPYERAIVRLLTIELQHLYKTGKLEANDPVLSDLPPRLRELAQRLRSDFSVKQIAKQMNLSIHTVRDYTKELYERLGVQSRAELLMRLR